MACQREQWGAARDIPDDDRVVGAAGQEKGEVRRGRGVREALDEVGVAAGERQVAAAGGEVEGVDGLVPGAGEEEGRRRGVREERRAGGRVRAGGEAGDLAAGAGEGDFDGAGLG